MAEREQPPAVTLPAAVTQIEEQNRALYAQVEALVVDSWEKHVAAGQMIAAAAAREKEVHHWTDEVCDSAHKAWKSATSLRSRLLDVPQKVRQILARKMGEWERTERERQAALERVAREEAQRKFDEQRFALAEQAEKRGDATMAEKLVEEIGRPAPPAPVPVDTPAPQRRFGGSTVSIPSVWRARATVENPLRALIAAAAKEPEKYERFLKLDDSALNARAKVDGKAFSVPGFEAYEDFTSRVR